VGQALAALGSALRQSNAEKQILKQLQRQQTEKGLRPSKRAPMLPVGGSFRSRAWQVASEPESSRAASAFSFLVLAAICISICAFCLESLPQFRSDPDRGVEDHKTFKAIEYACIAIFTVEYLVRLATCSVSAEYGVDAKDFDTSGGAGRPRGFLRASYAFVMSPMNLVDLVAILPFYLELAFAGGGGAAFSVLRVLRLARVFRVLKLGKFCSSLATLVRVMVNSASALYLLLFFMGLGCVRSLAITSTFSSSSYPSTCFPPTPLFVATGACSSAPPCSSLRGGPGTRTSRRTCAPPCSATASRRHRSPPSPRASGG
jgi:hypothetical protein